MLDLCLCEESKACRIIYNMIICSLLFWILVSSRTFHKLIICTVSLILEMYWLGYVTFTFRNINIVSISLLEGSSLIFQHTCIKHGNAEVPRILGFAMECFYWLVKNSVKAALQGLGFFLEFYPFGEGFIQTPSAYRPCFVHSRRPGVRT